MFVWLLGWLLAHLLKHCGFGSSASKTALLYFCAIYGLRELNQALLGVDTQIVCAAGAADLTGLPVVLCIAFDY